MPEKSFDLGLIMKLENEDFAGEGCSPLHEKSCIRTTHHISIPYDWNWWDLRSNGGRVRT